MQKSGCDCPGCDCHLRRSLKKYVIQCRDSANLVKSLLPCSRDTISVLNTFVIPLVSLYFLNDSRIIVVTLCKRMFYSSILSFYIPFKITRSIELSLKTKSVTVVLFKEKFATRQIAAIVRFDSKISKTIETGNLKWMKGKVRRRWKTVVDDRVLNRICPKNRRQQSWLAIILKTLECSNLLGDAIINANTVIIREDNFDRVGYYINGQIISRVLRWNGNISRFTRVTLPR